MLRASLSLLPALAFTVPLALAQTSTPHRSTTGAAHRPGTAAAARPAVPACAVLPVLSPKIPALPAGTPCPKPLFTVSDRLDYLAPIADRFRTTVFGELPIVISLNYAEITTGTGELAKPQQYYTVKYTGYLPDGTKFDASDDHEETSKGFTFPYGAHRVIAGWDFGFEGMRIGGKRRLFIPYQFAYGAGGQPPKIPPKSMLIFDMELLSQSDQPPAPPMPPTPPTTPPPAGAPATPPSPGSQPANPQQPGTPQPPATPGDKPLPAKPGTTTPPATSPSAAPQP